MVDVGDLDLLRREHVGQGGLVGFAEALHLRPHGFAVEAIELIPRPTPLSGHIGGWLRTFGGVYYALLDAAEHEAFEAELVELLTPVLSDGRGNWTTDYVRLRFRAHLR